MAQPVRRVRKSDGITTVQVKWRQGGRGSAWQSVTFASGSSAQNEARAMAFLVDVEEAGNQWPPGWPHDLGYHQPDVDPDQRRPRPPWSPWPRSPPTTSPISAPCGCRGTR